MRILASVLLFLSFGTIRADAAIFTFSGKVLSVSNEGGGVALDGSIYPGVLVSGSYTFSDDVLDTFPDTAIGVYFPSERFVASVGNYRLDSSYLIQVFNNSVATSNKDGYIITQANINDVGFSNGLNSPGVDHRLIHFSVFDRAGVEWFHSDAIPTIPFDFGAFPPNLAVLQGI